MESIESFKITLPLSVTLIPLSMTASACGNCLNWKGPRERNGRKSFICLDSSKGTCQLRIRDRSLVGEALTSPVSNSDCPDWELMA